MTQFTVFVDGGVGTTGLRIRERLSSQADICLLTLPEAQRKDLDVRLEQIAQADLTFLCLPDEASKEIVALAPPTAKICDTSTAFRTDPNWVYGFAELTGQRAQIAAGRRVAVPGCHATGFIALVRPLVEHGVLPADYPLSCHSLTGYSGGGKAMIADYQAEARSSSLDAPRMYGLGLSHKHLPEMTRFTGIQQPPMFSPVVCDYYNGMLVTVPITLSALPSGYRSGEAVQKLFADYYQSSPLIRVQAYGSTPTDGFLPANALADRDDLEIFVFSNADQLLLAARFDNLGKGASGAAIQCMNIMLGRAETAGLSL